MGELLELLLRPLGTGDVLAEQVSTVGVEYVAVDQPIQIASEDTPGPLFGAGCGQQPDTATSCRATYDRAMGGYEELHFRKAFDKPLSDTLLPCRMKMCINLVDRDHTGEGNRSRYGVDPVQRRLGIENREHEADREVDTAAVARDRTVDEAKLKRRRALEQLEVGRRKALEEAEIAADEVVERARIASDRGLDEARVNRERDLRRLEIERDQTVEIDEIDKSIALLRKS